MNTEQEFDELYESIKDLNRVIPLDLNINNWKQLQEAEVVKRINRVKLAQEAFFGTKPIDTQKEDIIDK